MPAELHTTLTPDTPVRYLKGQVFLIFVQK